MTTASAPLRVPSYFGALTSPNGQRQDISPLPPPVVASTTPNPLLLGRLEEKPKAVLCHELGAGSPCLKCGDRCEGLDLHYWRKICKNCFCRLDEHDVMLSRELDHGEFVIRKLFDSRPKSSYGGGELRSDEEHEPAENQPVGSARGGYGGIVEKLRQIHINAQNAAAVQSVMSSPADDTPKKFSLSRSGDARSLTPTSCGSPRSHGTISEAVGGYAWMPAGDRALVERYMTSLPDDERPVLGTAGAQLRRQRLAYQLPYHDCDTDAAKSLRNDEEQEKHRTFVEYVKQNVVGIGEICDVVQRAEHIATMTGPQQYSLTGNDDIGTCRTCAKGLKRADVGIFTEHGASSEIWHADCFRCDVCHQLLADLLYFFHDNRYYCGRHYGERMYPRCGGCDELIFAREYTFAEERAWHVDHFCCFGCDMHLGGHRYVTKENNTYCIGCYMQRFARTCATCTEKIAPFDSRISHKDLHWHANAQCFKCSTCDKSLTNQKFSLREGRTFCSTTCARAPAGGGKNS